MKKINLELSQQQIAYSGSLVIAILFFVFIAGYYWGKKAIIEQFSEKIQQESLADKIYSSMSILYDMPDAPDIVSSSDEVIEQAESSSLLAQDSVPQVAAESSHIASSSRSVEEEAKAINTLYVAKLIGFGFENAAQLYVQKLLKRDIKATVLEKKSTTSRGGIYTWYQVVVGPLELPALENIVEYLVSLDRLVGVKIVEHTSIT